MDYQNNNQGVNKKGNGLIIFIVLALIIVLGVIFVEPFISYLKTINNAQQSLAEDVVYAVIESVELAKARFLLYNQDKEIISLEDMKDSYYEDNTTWNEDNTITSEDYDFICNVTVNKNNEMVVSCDVNGKTIKSDPISLKVETDNENKNDTTQNNQTNNNQNVNNGTGNNIQNNQNTNFSLTEKEALQIGKGLYIYAHRVGNCKEFKYQTPSQGNQIVLNYEEVAKNFTNNYMNNINATYRNVFSSIEKDAEGKYRDTSVCGFGLSCATSSLTDFKLVNKSNDYITFQAIVTFTSTCGDNRGSIVRTETNTFAIKKENDTWKIDHYEFQIITDLLN